MKSKLKNVLKKVFFSGASKWRKKERERESKNREKLAEWGHEGDKPSMREEWTNHKHEVESFPNQK